MKKPRKKPVLHVVVCANCKQEFKTYMAQNNRHPKRYCPRERCQKIKKLRGSVATFDGVPNAPTVNTANMDYYGSTFY